MRGFLHAQWWLLRDIRHCSVSNNARFAWPRTSALHSTSSRLPSVLDYLSASARIQLEFCLNNLAFGRRLLNNLYVINVEGAFINNLNFLIKLSPAFLFCVNFPCPGQESFLDSMPHSIQHFLSKTRRIKLKLISNIYLNLQPLGGMTRLAAVHDARSRNLG